jgi:hypothetical protein
MDADGDDPTWSSIMPTIFDVLYREYCRARLTEMRKQLLLWPGTSKVAEVNRDAGSCDGAADRDAGLGPSHGWNNHEDYY